MQDVHADMHHMVRRQTHIAWHHSLCRLLYPGRPLCYNFHHVFPEKARTKKIVSAELVESKESFTVSNDPSSPTLASCSRYDSARLESWLTLDPHLLQVRRPLSIKRQNKHGA
jgi:hypothetical protein